MHPSLFPFSRAVEKDRQREREITQERARARAREKDTNRTHGSVGRLLDAVARGQLPDQVVRDAARGVGLEGSGELSRGGDAVVLVEELCAKFWFCGKEEARPGGGGERRKE